MSHIKTHKLRTYKPKEKKFKCPKIDELLPPLNGFEIEEEKLDFAIKTFNHFYINYVDSTDKRFFIRLPLKFFTMENATRIKEYAKIVFEKLMKDNEHHESDQ